MELSSEQKTQLRVEAKLELARRDFYDYCKLKYPEFYKKDRHYLKLLCNTLEKFYKKQEIDGRVYNKLMINMPPRHGKTFTIKNFCEYVFGDDTSKRIFDISYNEKLSTKFARAVRDSIAEERAFEESNYINSDIIYNDIFPQSIIKQGDASVSNWSLLGGYNSFLASSPNATITGMGCDLGIIDDLIKNRYEAYNENILNNHYEFYTDTFLSRLEEGSLQIIVMTRWSEHDLCGRLLKSDKDSWYVLSLPALIDEDSKEMLCDELLSYESYIDKTKGMNKEIASANYNQKILKGSNKLYKYFKYIEDNPIEDVEKTIAYVDTADTGKDKLCCLIADVYKGQVWLKDCYVSSENMEITEKKVAAMLFENNVNDAYIESNNGGRGFSRSVRKLLWDNFKSRKTNIIDFHQSKNKQARIISNSSSVMNNVFFPKNWNIIWKDFYDEITTYKSKGTNSFDDCADSLTGIIEKVQEPTYKKFYA